MTGNPGKLQRKSKRAEGLFLIPLIDVLLVTIFFLINSTFTENSTLQVQVPQALSGEKSIKQSITIEIDSLQKIIINQVPVSLDSFVTVLNEKKNSLGETSVFLAADGQVSYNFLIKIMDKIRLTGISDISLITEKGQP